MTEDKFIEISKELKAVIQKKTGLKFSRRVLSKAGNNPFIELSLINWEEDIIPNELRSLIAKTLNFEVTDWDNVIYGNIRDSYITLNYSDWVKILEVLKN